MKLSGIETDAVLAGLRLLQRELMGGWPEMSTDVEQIYTNTGAHAGLGVEEIDELCERINV